MRGESSLITPGCSSTAAPTRPENLSPNLALPGSVAALQAYDVPNARLEVQTAYTNAVPGGHMRGPGDVQAFFAGESHADMIAREMGLDPLEFRRLNALGSSGTTAGNEHYRFAGYAVEVAVDRAPGEVRLEDVLLVADVGTVLNPIGHQGQLKGAMAQGLGAALMEELPVEGGKVATLSLGEYKLPTRVDMPPLRTSLLPAHQGKGPFGAKAVGELSIAGVAPAVVNAVADAVGARITSLPITAEKVLAALGLSGQGLTTWS